jgi:predicted permease
VALLSLTIPWIFYLFPAAGGENFPNYRMLLTTALIVAAATLATGFFPALHATRPKKGGALQQGYSVVSSRSILRNALIVTQIALTLALTIGAGLFVRSVQNIKAIDLGYNPDRMLAVSIDMNRSGFSPSEISALYERMLERVTQLPAVESAALGRSYGTRMDIAGFFPGSQIQMGGEIQPSFNAVSPEYFSTLGTRILRGRAFTAHDTWQSTPVAIVGEGLAQKIWPGEDPIGKCISFGAISCFEVVGVCETRIIFSILPAFRDSNVYQEWFVPLSQVSVDDPGAKRFPTPPEVLFIRAREKSGSMGSVAAAVRSTIAPLYPDMPFIKIEMVANRFDDQTRQWDLGAKIFSYFGALALAVSAIGIYGVLAFFIRSRTAEIGLRMALGATRFDIAIFILRKGFIPVGIGIVLGIVLSMQLSKLLQNQLYGLEHTDPASFAIAVGVIILAACLACFIPAWRAVRINPLSALRKE